ncbi:hypothetical protein YC2023_103486 [Brassica napus]
MIQEPATNGLKRMMETTLMEILKRLERSYELITSMLTVVLLDRLSDVKLRSGYIGDRLNESKNLRDILSWEDEQEPLNNNKRDRREEKSTPHIIILDMIHWSLVWNFICYR